MTTTMIRGRSWFSWAPPWMQTIRFRLTVTYSAVLFVLAVLVLGGVYLALRTNVEAKPLDPITVSKAYKDAQGEWHLKPNQQFQAADINSVESAVNFRLLQKMETYSFAAAGGLLLVSLATGWWLSGRALRPVRRIAAAAQDISANDLTRRIALDGPRDELRTLADTVDGMLGRLEGAFAAQRQMMDDASHELRNPLAVIQANVDAVLAHEDATPEARTQAAAIVTRATSRMTRLVEDLLAAARRSSPAFRDVEVDLATVASEAAEEYEALAASRGISITRRLASGPVVAGDPQAIRRAIDNLLSNAVRLAPGDTDLVLAVGSRSGWAWIAVRDQGPGIADADTGRIFDRFYRPEGRATPERTGERRAGLGLAIVRQIVESHAGTVTVHSALRVGSTFVLWFPDRAHTDITRRTPEPPPENPLLAAPRVVG